MCHAAASQLCTRAIAHYSQQRHLSQCWLAQEFNATNVLGHRGAVADAYGQLINVMWAASAEQQLSPEDFKAVISRVMPQFQGYAQHDVQEFLAFLLDAVHEDLNRVVQKPELAPDAAQPATNATAAATAAKVRQQCASTFKY
jgi:ubiquitin C-terminal hydrolase